MQYACCLFATPMAGFQCLYYRVFLFRIVFRKNTASPPGEDDFSPKPGGPGLAVRKEAFANFAR